MKYQHAHAGAQLITDWYSLGAALDFKPGALAWVLRERTKMQRRIRLGKRTVYQSAPLLLAVQNRLISLVAPLVDALPEESCILAYRQGRSYVETLKKHAGSELLITTDVCKYYDHIQLGHIEAALAEQGFTPTGARLIGRYCVVRTRFGQTLQQGSPVSPALSNLVGARCLDRPILHWLRERYPSVDAAYLRYCDNLALFVRGSVPEDFPQAYKSAVRDLLAERGFQTHKWRTISGNHPKIHQEFLGIVLNRAARLDRSRIDEQRAVLNNFCLRGLTAQGREYLSRKGLVAPGVVEDMTDDEIRKKIKSLFRGHLAYSAPVNGRQAAWLKKLYLAALALDDLEDRSALVRPKSLTVIHSYRHDAESPEAYVSRVIDAVSQEHRLALAAAASDAT